MNPFVLRVWAGHVRRKSVEIMRHAIVQTFAPGRRFESACRWVRDAARLPTTFIAQDCSQRREGIMSEDDSETISIQDAIRLKHHVNKSIKWRLQRNRASEA